MPKNQSQRGPGRKRGPPKRNDKKGYLLKMPNLDQVRAAAKSDGISLAQWWREAAVLRLRQSAREMPETGGGSET